MKYIDADRLRAEINDLCTNANFYQQKAMEESNREDFVSSGGEILGDAQPAPVLRAELRELINKIKEK